MKELTIAELLEDLPEHNLKAGDQGIIMLVHGDGDAYEIEFAPPLVATVPASKVKRAEKIKRRGS